MDREIDRQQEREAVKKKALIQIAERAQPAKRAGEENYSRHVAEQQVSQPAPSRSFAGKPDRDDQQRERDPAQPALIEWRETGGAKNSARD